MNTFEWLLVGTALLLLLLAARVRWPIFVVAFGAEHVVPRTRFTSYRTWDYRLGPFLLVVGQEWQNPSTTGREP